MSRLTTLLLGATLLIATPSIANAQSDPTPTVNITWDKSVYAINDVPRLTVNVKSGTTAYTGVCVTYTVRFNGNNFANNSGVCGLGDLTDGSGSATWLLPTLTTSGTYVTDVTTAPQAGIVGAGSASSTFTLGQSTGSGSQPAPTSGTTKATQGAIVTLPNPIKCNDATCLVTQVIRYVLGIVAVIATMMFVWGGVLMLTSGGNSDQVRKAKETLTWAAIGVIVILMSWVIIKFVLQAVTGTTS